MARGRMLSKTLSCSRRFNALVEIAGPLAEFTQLLYTLTIPHVDDFGRMTGDPFSLKLIVMPASTRPAADFIEALKALHEVNLLTIYEASGDIWLQVNKFDEHQVGLHKRADQSKIPSPPGNSRKFPEIPGNSWSRARAELNLTELNLNEPNRTEEKIRAVPAARNSRHRRKDERTPAENIKVITKIAHEVLNQNGHRSDSDAVEAVKELCAKRHIAYDSLVVRKAIDSAEAQTA